MRKTANHAQWISWDDACKQIHSVVGSLELAAADLWENLRSGKIHAIDRVVIEHSQVETLDLPPEFWNSTVYVGIGMESSGRTTTHFVGWWLNDGYKLADGLHFIFLNREDIATMWPNEPAALAAQTRQMRVGGRPPGPAPKHNWPMLLAAYIVKRLLDGDNITDNDSKLAKQFCEYCSSKGFDWQPELSAVRDKIPEILQFIRSP
jgi:hypothetical protein